MQRRGSACEAASSGGIAITTTDGRAPTAAQLARIHRVLASEIAKRGLTIVQNADAANHVLAVRLAPDPLTSDDGHVTVIGLQSKRRSGGSSPIDEMKAEADSVHRRMSVPE